MKRSFNEQGATKNVCTSVTQKGEGGCAFIHRSQVPSRKSGRALFKLYLFDIFVSGRNDGESRETTRVID